MTEKKKHTILVVEDEQPLLDAVRIKLENHGCDVLTARDVVQAFSYVEDTSVQVDAIWLDHYLLGKETGLDFVAQLKASEHSKELPIFVVSNTATPEKKHTYLRLGAVKYYVKADFRLDTIVEEIKDYLERGE